MNIKAVKLMRNLRDKINSDIEGLSWEQELEYLKQHSKTFDFITNKTPNKKIQRTV